MKLKYIAFLILIFFICIFIFFSYLESNRVKKIVNFKLEIIGVLLDKRSIDHDRAKCKIYVTKSNKEEYFGKGLFGGEVFFSNDTAIMELICDHCLRVGDTIFVSSKYILKIKNGNDIIYINNVQNDCYKYGRK